MKALELKAKTDKKWNLNVNIPLNTRNKNVRVLILIDEGELEDEKIWLYSNSKNPSFDFLNDPEEDVYSLNDGKSISENEK